MKKLTHIIKNMDVYVGCACFTVMVLIVVANVTMRYVFSTGYSWAEEIILILFAWSSYLGIAAAYRYDRHIRVETVYKMFPKSVQKALDIITDIGIFVLTAYITYLAVVLCSHVGSKRTVVMRLPINIVNSCLIAGFLLIAISAFHRIVSKIRGTYVLEELE